MLDDYWICLEQDYTLSLQNVEQFPLLSSKLLHRQKFSLFTGSVSAVTAVLGC